MPEASGSLVRLPSLDLLKSFVAVGRHLSITRAAQDLCLTQSAVSRQVLALEDALGCRLLVRGHRTLAFTSEGERVFREGDKIIQRWQETVAALRRERGPVTINASVGVASLWLLPRLGAFQARYPEIDLRVLALNRQVDLREESMDLTLRYGPTAAVPAGALRLFGEAVAPVAHPALIQSLTAPADLEGQVLLEFDDPQRPWLQWGHWLEQAGWGGVKPRAVLHFNQYDQAIHAALAGQGIALGRFPLLSHWLAAGQLQRLGAAPVEADHAYWLIVGDKRADPDVTRVADWIRQEAAEQKA